MTKVTHEGGNTIIDLIDGAVEPKGMKRASVQWNLADKFQEFLDWKELYDKVGVPYDMALFATFQAIKTVLNEDTEPLGRNIGRSIAKTGAAMTNALQNYEEETE